MAGVGDDRDPPPGGDDMSALPVEEEPIEPAPSPRVWPVPPPEGWTADDLDRIPDLPPHTELIDGSLIFMSPQRILHMILISLLEQRLKDQAPPAMWVLREISTVISAKNRPLPDLMIVDARKIKSRKDASVPVEAVSLAVEVVSPDSELRDRERKPRLYAEAGIQHFWRIELEEDESAVAYVYELDPATKQYSPSGVFREHLKVTVPFNIDVDLAELDEVRLPEELED
ncbi:Uma2 family endonuclease [Nocardiopsis suaedae]|uniref:Uma2 family endonuclease n=1 Tax=Nocardiopsis suaedae TaxID=3018444 RepID=A0ABT4TPU4_9ACTN|nr:Uma2 family endonuclease [Nocardiopsis suaedae]MDA2806671.1 Uma2 family endonuclease [Nocardiopsis suaedae]